MVDRRRNLITLQLLTIKDPYFPRKAHHRRTHKRHVATYTHSRAAQDRTRNFAISISISNSIRKWLMRVSARFGTILNADRTQPFWYGSTGVSKKKVVILVFALRFAFYLICPICHTWIWLHLACCCIVAAKLKLTSERFHVLRSTLTPLQRTALIRNIQWDG